MALFSFSKNNKSNSRITELQSPPATDKINEKPERAPKSYNVMTSNKNSEATNLSKRHFALHIILLVINFILCIIILALFFGISKHISTTINFQELEMLLGSSQGFFAFIHSLIAIAYKNNTRKK